MSEMNSFDYCGQISRSLRANAELFALCPRNSWTRRSDGVTARAMSKPIAAALALKHRPIWIVPLVTALVVVAALMVFYPSTPPV
jgi:hypothetical protein